MKHLTIFFSFLPFLQFSLEIGLNLEHLESMEHPQVATLRPRLKNRNGGHGCRHFAAVFKKVFVLYENKMQRCLPNVYGFHGNPFHINRLQFDRFFSLGASEESYNVLHLYVHLEVHLLSSLSFIPCGKKKFFFD